MDFPEAKEQFVQTWGSLGSNWGINKTMAQIYALLLISPDPLSTDEIMDDLQISRGNANMNIRALLDWGIVYKKFIRGKRQDFFVANKDVWQVGKKIIYERNKREISPVIQILKEVQSVKGNSAEIKEFKKVTSNIRSFTSKWSRLLEKVSKKDNIWLSKKVFDAFL